MSDPHLRQQLRETKKQLRRYDRALTDIDHLVLNRQLEIRSNGRDRPDDPEFSTLDRIGRRVGRAYL